MDFIGLRKIGINFRVGWEALLRNKFRFLLTLLGIILGIFIVVTTVSLSGNIKILIAEMNRRGDTTGLSIGKREWYEKSPGKYERSPKTANLGLQDVEEILEYCPSVSIAAAANVFGRLDTVHRGKTMPYKLLGVTIGIKNCGTLSSAMGLGFGRAISIQGRVLSLSDQRSRMNYLGNQTRQVKKFELEMSV